MRLTPLKVAFLTVKAEKFGWAYLEESQLFAFLLENIDLNIGSVEESLLTD